MSRAAILDAAALALAAALFAIACARIDAAVMARCTERHSFATCHGALNR